eukprot:3343106-Amphidinium_carterae.1
MRNCRASGSEARELILFNMHLCDGPKAPFCRLRIIRNWCRQWRGYHGMAIEHCDRRFTSPCIGQTNLIWVKRTSSIGRGHSEAPVVSSAAARLVK